MAVGGGIALLLDNIIPGTLEERGILKWRSLVTSQHGTSMASVHVYDLPFGFSKTWKFSKYIPFLPYYDDKDTVQPPVTRSSVSSIKIKNSGAQSPSYNAQTYL